LVIEGHQRGVAGDALPLYQQKNGNPVYVAIPHQAAEAVLAIPPMSEMYFF
jgi:hypothetical protein